MTQPLNYTPKAIEQILSYPSDHAPGMAAGFRYIAAKLREAQVFVLSDHGQLLDRSKPRPEVPGVLFRPPFPVVALEYAAAPQDWNQGFYDAAKCSRRIALAWEWTDDLPPELRKWAAPNLGEGVAIASIAYFDAQEAWFPIATAVHLAYDQCWQKSAATPFQKSMIEVGRLSQKQANAKSMAGMPIGLLPEPIVTAVQAHGGGDHVFDALMADLTDEVSAYSDLCYALACKNVSTREHPAPQSLNRNRIRAGKLPLKSFHVLEMSGGGAMPGSAGGGGDRAAARSHLRRGHIRRLDRERVTWVNSTIVSGRGFVDKVYAA